MQEVTKTKNNLRLLTVLVILVVGISITYTFLAKDKDPLRSNTSSELKISIEKFEEIYKSGLSPNDPKNEISYVPFETLEKYIEISNECAESRDSEPKNSLPPNTINIEPTEDGDYLVVVGCSDVFKFSQAYYEFFIYDVEKEKILPIESMRFHFAMYNFDGLYLGTYKELFGGDYWCGTESLYKLEGVKTDLIYEGTSWRDCALYEKPSEPTTFSKPDELELYCKKMESKKTSDNYAFPLIDSCKDALYVI